MVDEKRRDIASKPEEAQPGSPEAAGQQGQRIKISFEGVKPEYANFCTLTLRGDEIYMSFGRAFGPTTELKIETQIVMSLKNVEQLHAAMGKLLEQAHKPAAGK